MTNEELDRLIAERVMGWTLQKGLYRNDAGDIMFNQAWPEYLDLPYWHPTNDIVQAFEAVDKLIAGGYEIEVRGIQMGRWIVLLFGHKERSLDGFGDATELPQAICLSIYNVLESEK